MNQVQYSIVARNTQYIHAKHARSIDQKGIAYSIALGTMFSGGLCGEFARPNVILDDMYRYRAYTYVIIVVPT